MRKRSHRAALRIAANLLCVGVLAHAFTAPLAEAQERRGRRTPGLVLEPGALHATCDVVTFTPSGDELLTAGDDKVVRQWQVDKAGHLGEAGRVLRWPIYRERRGGIHAMALSPDPDARHVAVTGFGVKDGLVMVLDRQSGEVVHVLDDRLSPAVNWALAWSPDGRFLVFGNEYGDVFRWEPGARAGAVRRFAGKKDGKSNRVRLLAFTDATHFLSVAQDGKVWLRDVLAPDAFPTAPVAALEGREHQKVAAAAFSRASKRLAACQDYRPGLVLWMDLTDALAGGEAGRARTQYLLVPEDKQTRRYPWSLAFNARGDKLAAGTRDATEGGAVKFSEVTGGAVFVYSLAGPSPQFLGSKQGLDCGYAVDALAFRPGAGDQLATAGGPDHELRIWAYGKPAAPISEVRSPGSCLWSVAVDAKGKYLAWREQPNRKPAHANDRGAGPWRYFRLDRTTRHILAHPPADFTPVRPIDTLAGWTVRPTKNSFVWEIVEPKKPGEEEVVHQLSARAGLYNASLNQLPRCYTFLPATADKPVRLAVGHMWGVSLYELRPGDVRLARYMAGHEGEVMAVAPSADGKLLYTASRDQTLGCWSLVDWPYQGEFGAGFRAERGGLVIAGVAPGSPAWEMGLTDGDEVVLVLSRDRSGPGAFLYDPEKGGVAKYKLELAPEMRSFNRGDLLKHFERPEPGREYIFGWRHGGKDAPVKLGLTTLPQRPLWRFFPTRQDEGSQWVLWRWRDFYYDTMSPRPDRLVGWHVYDADNLKVAPAFHPLGQFGGRLDARGAHVDGFYDPDRVWKFMASAYQEPEKVLFPQIEPPRIESLVVAKPPPDKDNDLKLHVRIAPREPKAALGDQRITRVVLWHDDARVPTRWHLDPATGAVRDSIVIPRARLRRGPNQFKLVAFNAEGGRAEEAVVVHFTDPTRPKPTLRGLCVGIDKYGGAKLFGDDYRLDDLNYSVADAKLMDQVLRQQQNSALFEKCLIDRPLFDRDATAGKILERVRELGRDVGPDDWVVLFLSGHGLPGNTPGAFCYVCTDSVEAKPGTLLRADDLHDVLRDIPCRKLIFLDACHSGNVAKSPIRGLNKDGVEFRIFSACKPHQAAGEPKPEVVASRKIDLRAHGLFTQSLMEALGYPEAGKKGRPNPVTEKELADKVCAHLRVLLRRLGEPETAQEPEFFPERKEMRDLQLLSRP
jgi:WD40 repeat protein